MCVVSMVVDYYFEKWQPRVPSVPTFPKTPHYPVTPIAPTFPGFQPPGSQIEPLISKEELEEFKELLERARLYDEQNNQKDCSMEEKKDRIKRLAKQLGVDVSFVEGGK